MACFAYIDLLQKFVLQHLTAMFISVIIRFSRRILPQNILLVKTVGRAIAQAVSRRLLTEAARVQSRVWSCGILWWKKVVLGQDFSENFGFPCQSTFHLLLHNHLHYHPRLAQ
jgi:hypothetical protein